MKQYTASYLLVGLVVLLTIALLYPLLVPPDQAGLASSRWILFAVFATALILLAIGTLMLRQLRGLPPPPSLSRSEIGFSTAVTAILCPLTFLAVWVWGPFGSLAIMLVPIAFILRFNKRLLVNARTEEFK